MRMGIDHRILCTPSSELVFRVYLLIIPEYMLLSANPLRTACGTGVCALVARTRSGPVDGGDKRVRGHPRVQTGVADSRPWRAGAA